MSDPRPVCGLQPGQPDQSPTWTEVLTIIGAVSSAVGVPIGVWKIINGASQFSLLGLGAVGWAGIAGAVVAAAVVGYMFFARCWPRDGAPRCWAGAVNHITTSFDSGWDNIFPSGAMHPCVDVVLKPAYWDIVAQGAGQIDCSNAPTGVGSPLIHSFFHSSRVCDAALGATIGAAVGVGVAVALAIAIAAACATVIACLFALLVAALIGAFIALSGAALGGAIGRSLAGSDEPTTSDDGAPITVGQLVTVNGNLITMGEFDLTNCGWWVTSCSQHGSVQAPPDYDDTQASQLDPDACSMTGVIV
jgi:hypothetical protein